MKQKAKTLGILCFIIQTLLCVSHQLQNIGRDAEKKISEVYTTYSWLELC